MRETLDRRFTRRELIKKGILNGVAAAVFSGTASAASVNILRSSQKRKDRTPGIMIELSARNWEGYEIISDGVTRFLPDASNLQTEDIGMKQVYLLADKEEPFTAIMFVFDGQKTGKLHSSRFSEMSYGVRLQEIIGNRLFISGAEENFLSKEARQKDGKLLDMKRKLAGNIQRGAHEVSEGDEVLISILKTPQAPVGHALVIDRGFANNDKQCIIKAEFYFPKPSSGLESAFV